VAQLNLPLGELTDSFPAIATLGIGLASPMLIWTITRPRSETPADQVRLLGAVFMVTIAGLVITRFGVIPLPLWLNVSLF
jgi:hypothetical protein